MDEREEWIERNAALARRVLLDPAVRAELLALLGADDSAQRRERRLEDARRDLASMELRWKLTVDEVSPFARSGTSGVGVGRSVAHSGGEVMGLQVFSRWVSEWCTIRYRPPGRARSTRQTTADTWHTRLHYGDYEHQATLATGGSTMAVPDGPIEVWLRLTDLAVTCTVVYEDESTTNLNVQALSMRGAEHEITDFLVDQGYKPVGRWHAEGEYGQAVSRRFTPPKEVTPTKTP